MKLDDFTFDGMKASDYGVKMRDFFTLEGAAPSNSLNKKLLGRNGNLTAWDGSYANRKGTAKCFLLDTDASEKMDQTVEKPQFCVRQNWGFEHILDKI